MRISGSFHVKSASNLKSISQISFNFFGLEHLKEKLSQLKVLSFSLEAEIRKSSNIATVVTFFYILNWEIQLWKAGKKAVIRILFIFYDRRTFNDVGLKFNILTSKISDLLKKN